MNKLMTAFILGGVFFGRAFAGTVPQLVLQPESTLTLEGNSTFHPYASTATVVHVEAELASTPGTGLAQGIIAGQVKKFKVMIPVKSLKSGESGLDKKMYKALRAKEFSDIHFGLTSYDVLPSSSPDVFPVKAKGLLSISGVEKQVELNAEIRLAGERMRVQGSQPILMTDYGIKPPTFLGMLKTDNRVVVHYDLTLIRKEVL